MTLLLAVLSSVVFGAGVALQQHQADAVPDEYAGRPALFVQLLCRPVWVFGIGVEMVGFGLQVAALRTGSLVLVQPILATSLLCTVALSAAWSGQEVRAREWLAMLAVVGGLVGFLVLAAPSQQSVGIAGGWEWLSTLGALGVGVAAALLAGMRRHGPPRAALLGLAAGLGDATMVVLTKAFARATDGGVAHLLATWAPYALCAAGIVALLVSQTAYQAGHPTVSLPIISVTEPVVTCAIGVGLFGESLHLAGYRGPAALLSVMMLVTGLVVVTRSSHAADAREENREENRERARIDEPG
ncbi:MAG: DMT family transporter [Actinomycetota bacterium]|nr:DMT family transporter [Actinomycetota bacterium]